MGYYKDNRKTTGRIMRTEITTREIAKIFDKTHRDITRIVRKVLSCDIDYAHLFKEKTYLNSRGKEYPEYVMNLDGFSVLSDHTYILAGFKKAEIINEFGGEVVIVGSKRTRSEDIFYGMLCEFLPHLNIIRQFPVNGYRVDFYLEGVGLFIEFDEEQHFSPVSKKADEERWREINAFLQERDGYTTGLIRVNKGSEIYGLSLIMSYLALTLTTLATHAAETNDKRFGAIYIGPVESEDYKMACRANLHE